MGPPTPSPASECCPPPFGTKGGDTLACEEGPGGPNSDEGTDALVLHVYHNPFTGVSVPLSPCLNHCNYSVKSINSFSLNQTTVLLQYHSCILVELQPPPPPPSQTTALQQYLTDSLHCSAN